MVQIDIPAGFVVSMLAIDLGRQALKKDYDSTQTEKSPLYYRYLFRSLLFADACRQERPLFCRRCA